MEHLLNSYIPYFQDTLNGQKRHEIRPIASEGQFQVGDILVLQEYDQTKGVHTGRQQRAVVTWVSPPNGEGKMPGFAYLSIQPLQVSWKRWFNARLFNR